MGIDLNDLIVDLHPSAVTWAQGMIRDATTHLEEGILDLEFDGATSEEMELVCAVYRYLVLAELARRIDTLSDGWRLVHNQIREGIERADDLTS